MHLIRLLFILLLLQGGAHTADAEQPVPVLRSRITDQAGVLRAEQAAGIEGILSELERTKGSQIAVLVVHTTLPETIEQYALRVAERWKLGRKRIDDGALFVVAVDDRKMRIETGYGLEGALNDAICKRIIEEVIKPHFQTGDMAAGIRAGVEQMVKVVSGETLPPPGKTSTQLDPAAKILILVFFAAIAGGAALRGVLGRPLSAVLSGGAVFLSGAFVQPVILAVILALIVFLILLFGETRGSCRPGGRWSSGGNLGGGSSGGNFSGGGGSFGGGGASGGW